MAVQTLDLIVIRAAIAELDQLARHEYGCSLEDLLLDPSGLSAMRMQRIVGIVLKRPFAREAGPVAYARTGARRSWPWAAVSPEDLAAVAPAELAVLDKLRMPGSWNERKPDTGSGDDEPISWSSFKDDADNERGLFKILALYVDDRLARRGTKKLQQYLEARESPRFEAGLDLATLAFDAAVTAPLAALLGIPTLAVGVALVGIQYGYRRMTDANGERVGDQFA